MVHRVQLGDIGFHSDSLVRQVVAVALCPWHGEHRNMTQMKVAAFGHALRLNLLLTLPYRG